MRVMTTNAGGSDELVGIDNIAFTMDAEPAPLAATDPGDKTGQVGMPITEFDLAATGGTPPYTWEAVGLPAGIEVAADGTVSGTPTTERRRQRHRDGDRLRRAHGRDRRRGVHLHDHCGRLPQDDRGDPGHDRDVPARRPGDDHPRVS